ncbi:MAG: primosomal protein N' [Myxococcales bacterium]|nr:primosomal protein N' [Myxococcales bacterium]
MSSTERALRPCFASVAVPVPLGHALTYLVPPELVGVLRPGARVVCTLGARRVVGVVFALGDAPPGLALERIKPIGGVLDPEPVLPTELLAFLGELAEYYLAPIGEVLRLALPAVEREQVRSLEEQGVLAHGERVGGGKRRVGGRLVQFARPTERCEPPGKLRGQSAALLALLRASGERSVTELETRFSNARAALRTLAEQGLVALERRPAPVAAAELAEAVRDTPPELTPAQLAAVARIDGALAARFSAGASGSAASPAAPPSDAPGAEPLGFLLFGVTGSGKTEVYMHAVARTLAAGRGALVLVPEIALTPQLLGRFRARFGDAAALLHSDMAESERYRMWQRLRSGELRVALGARSALFAPVADLGLVVVDEEHDGSFKQEEGVRYHARDMAMLRAHRAGAVVVLGSATPSLESVALVRRGRLAELDLPERAHAAAALPAVEIVDLRRHRAGPTGHRLLTTPLHRAIEQTLGRQEQVILFLNRRGFSPSVVCSSCGTVVSCKSCSVALTFHQRRGGRLMCHYCEFTTALPERCPDCRVGELTLEGLGTEKLEDAVAEAFPTARVGRLDRDVASGARSERVLDKLRRRELDILVGTQMVTKGHDLPGVTLVGVVNADAALSMPDFRAAERGFQLLVQVAGRAGRHDRPGRVVVQTRDPSHPAIRFAASHDVRGFLAHELADRRELRYPPWSRLALLRVEAASEQVARAAALELATRARATEAVTRGDVEVLGPAPAPIARLRARYRFRVLLRARARPPLRFVLQSLAPVRQALDRSVRSVFDVDPVSML